VRRGVKEVKGGGGGGGGGEKFLFIWGVFKSNLVISFHTCNL
jgi:hypothetical protein